MTCQRPVRHALNSSSSSTCKVHPCCWRCSAIQQAAAGGYKGAHRQQDRHIVAALHIAATSCFEPAWTIVAHGA